MIQFFFLLLHLDVLLIVKRFIREMKRINLVYFSFSSFSYFDSFVTHPIRVIEEDSSLFTFCFVTYLSRILLQEIELVILALKRFLMLVYTSSKLQLLILFNISILFYIDDERINNILINGT
jgi:hypothetical protein